MSGNLYGSFVEMSTYEHLLKGEDLKMEREDRRRSRPLGTGDGRGVIGSNKKVGVTGNIGMFGQTGRLPPIVVGSVLSFGL